MDTENNLKNIENDVESISADRLESLLISAFDWASEISDTAIHDIIRATGITSVELEAIGYEEENFPELHEAANEN